MHATKYFLPLLLLLLGTIGVRHASAQEYFKILETGNNYYEQKIDRFANKDVIIANSSLESLVTGDEIGEITLQRLDECGNEVWAKIYRYEDGYLEVKDVAVNENGDIFVYGSHYKGLAEVLFLAKYEGLTGENLDFRLFDPGTVDHFSYNMDYQNGRLMVYGLLFDFNTAKLGFIAVFNENLAYLWSKRFEPFESSGYATITADDGFAGRSGPYLYKFTSEGEITWCSQMEPGTELATISGPVQTPEGFIFEANRNGESFFYQLDNSGELIWQSELFSATNGGCTLSPEEEGNFVGTYCYTENNYTQLAQLRLSADGSISAQRYLLLNERLITGSVEQALHENGRITIIGNSSLVALEPTDINDFILQLSADSAEQHCHEWVSFSDLRPNEMPLNLTPATVDVSEFNLEQINRLRIDAENFEIPFWEYCENIIGPTVIEIDTTIACEEEWIISLPDADFSWIDIFSTAPRLLEEPGTYQARKSTCNDPIIINYTLRRPSCPCEVFLPNVFSPNNDGQNDLLELFANCNIDQISASVFDRWGNLLHQSDQQNLLWDGNSGGRALNNGVYLIVLEYQWSDANGTHFGQVAQSITLFR